VTFVAQMPKTLTALTLAAALLIDADGRARADPDNGSTTPALQMPRQGVDVARGDEWIYQTRDSLTGDTLSDMDVVVVDKQADNINVRIRVTDPNTGMVRTGAATFDSFWRRVPDDIGPGKGAQDSWGVRPNLQVGDDWNYNFDRHLSGGPIVMGWIGHGEAVGVERLDLPNGRTVDALKIEFTERPSVARYHFEMHVVEWFAPEMNRYVRREVETRTEGEITESTTEILQDYVRRR
jgi:hypothetical protein